MVPNIFIALPGVTHQRRAAFGVGVGVHYSLAASASNLLICVVGVGVKFTHLRRRRQFYSSAASASNLLICGVGLKFASIYFTHIFNISEI
jgi:hypothetical protein